MAALPTLAPLVTDAWGDTRLTLRAAPLGPQASQSPCAAGPGRVQGLNRGVAASLPPRRWNRCIPLRGPPHPSPTLTSCVFLNPGTKAMVAAPPADGLTLQGATGREPVGGQGAQTGVSGVPFDALFLPPCGGGWEVRWDVRGTGDLRQRPPLGSACPWIQKHHGALLAHRCPPEARPCAPVPGGWVGGVGLL